ncbi:hypothetical protein JH06_4071 [Blastocystis sp. subtype 4]|uniref:hypothetical protein n=1 Tax=Blastocystis sp. subtype 4 TaxID=944170 RepID=UPI000711ADC3|nr:hypothetical protein JH06_4071 [Blastocystis sp. subtype 4]KNB43357.1 hypothetical protein JH06_4071 [Blastocystis sp. subtype 4]|eukprot:XP_014526800.1 hypothetical protein JH06_4071 [Blastocystis sp. subtype 4]
MSSVLNFVANPVRSYVSSLLVSALSKYIVALGILSQELNLQNVELNLTSIESDLGLKLPFVIKSSFAKSLKIVIPWTSLLSLPVGVYIESLNIELEDKVRICLRNNIAPEKDTDDSFSAESPNTEDTSNRNETTSKGMWGDRYLKRILANLSIRIDNIILRYSHEYIHCVLTSKVQFIDRFDI